MAARRLTSERAAQVVALALAAGLPLAALLVRWSGTPATAGAVELHGAVAEAGGWLPGNLTVRAGQPLRLRLTSDDVVHGFAVGKTDIPAVDVMPGQVTETTLWLERPGTYTFYCTRWCGPNHWRMRGTIEVVGPTQPEPPAPPPLYVTLGLDIDAPHPAAVVPAQRPSAERGAALGVSLPTSYLARDFYRSHSPVETWRGLRAEPEVIRLTDAELWDLVALVWQSNTRAEALAEGRALFAANCAACHGESGQGDGVMAQPVEATAVEAGHGRVVPANFADPNQMLGASPALLQGKVIRGGMGTGMPYWGPIFTDDQTWAVVDYLWTFQMEITR